MAAHMLARDNCRPCRHAYDVLIVCPLIVDARRRETVNDRCARDLPTITAKCVMALLICRHKENFPSQTASSQVLDRMANKLTDRAEVGDTSTHSGTLKTQASAVRLVENSQTVASTVRSNVVGIDLEKRLTRLGSDRTSNSKRSGSTEMTIRLDSKRIPN